MQSTVDVDFTGIYAGDGRVIHAVRGPGRGSFMDSSSPFYSSNNHVESISINNFVSGGELYLYQYGVNLGYFIAKIRGGACTLASSDTTKFVLDRAKFLLRYKHEKVNEHKVKRKEGFGAYHLFSYKRRKGKKIKVIVGSYDLFRNNCEDFAIYCKTSLAVRGFVPVGRSGQIACLFAAAGFLFSFYIPYLTSNLIRVVAGYCIYSTYRIISDTKYRWDTCIIPVEE